MGDLKFDKLMKMTPLNVLFCIRTVGTEKGFLCYHEQLTRATSASLHGTRSKSRPYHLIHLHSLSDVFAYVTQMQNFLYPLRFLSQNLMAVIEAALTI